MSKDKKKKLQGFDKAVLKRVLTHILKIIPYKKCWHIPYNKWYIS